jgi:AcrR family transcriptional regulator
VPRLWTTTVEEHRREVRQAILDATWRLATESGLRSVTMSAIADQVGIGRATLYKYFPNVEAILDAQHQQHVAEHLERLGQLSEQPGEPRERLARVLEAYALIGHHRERHGGDDLFARLHRPGTVQDAEERVRRLMQDLIRAALQADDLTSGASAE